MSAPIIIRKKGIPINERYPCIFQNKFVLVISKYVNTIDIMIINTNKHIISMSCSFDG